MVNTQFSREQDRPFPPIYLDMPSPLPEGWMTEHAEEILELIIRSFHCRQCQVWKDSQREHSDLWPDCDPPHLRSFYPNNEKTRLQINFSCPRSGTYGKKSCWSPHTINLPD